MSTFDFAAYQLAMEAKDADAWAGFFADDAVWTEYRHADPPRAPHVMSGKHAIASFLTGVCAAPLTISISRSVVGQERAAYMLTCVLGDGRRILENVIVEIRNARICEQIDVEAWD